VVILHSRLRTEEARCVTTLHIRDALAKMAKGAGFEVESSAAYRVAGSPDGRRGDAFRYDPLCAARIAGGSRADDVPHHHQAQLRPLLADVRKFRPASGMFSMLRDRPMLAAMPAGVTPTMRASPRREPLSLSCPSRGMVAKVAADKSSFLELATLGTALNSFGACE
jgi:hypothetical protein